MKHLLLLPIYFFCTVLFAQSTGKYQPFPDQYEIVDFFVDGKTKYAITKKTVLKEKKGLFLRTFTSRQDITAVASLSSNVIIGTESGLFRIDKKNDRSTSIAMPSGKNDATRGIVQFKEKVFVAFENLGIYSLSNEADLSLEKEMSGVKKIFTDGKAVYAFVGDGVYVHKGSNWVKHEMDGYAEHIGADSIRNIRTDKFNYMWVIGNKYVHVVDLNKTTDNALVCKNKFENKEVPIYDLIFVEEVGYFFLSSQQSYLNRCGAKDPLEQFGVSSQFYETATLVKKSVSFQLKNATGFRTGEKLAYMEKGSVYWIVNSNGAIGLSHKEMKDVL